MRYFPPGCDLLPLTRGVGLLSCVEKDEQGPVSEAWDVDPSLITKLKEQYKKERKGKKGVKSKSSPVPLLTGVAASFLFSLLLLFLFLLRVTFLKKNKEPQTRFIIFFKLPPPLLPLFDLTPRTRRRPPRHPTHRLPVECSAACRMSSHVFPS